MQEDEKILISKVVDKIRFCNTKNKIQTTDFLNMYEQSILEKFLKVQKIKNYIFTGGLIEAERKILVLYPEKMTDLIENINLNNYLKVIRIILPNEQKGKYTHKDYLGGLMKLGIKREKIGDIIVSENGADIIITPEIEKFLLSNLIQLTRFQKSKIELIDLENIRKSEIEKQKFNITVASMRLDCIVAELAHCSRSKAEELLLQQRIFINNECVIKQTKEVKENDKITIRGKGRFEIKSIVGNTKKGKIVIEIEC